MTDKPNPDKNPDKPGGFENLIKDFLNTPHNPRKVEPRPEFVQGARATWEMYTAYTQAGFTPAQALQIVIAIITQGGKQ